MENLDGDAKKYKLICLIGQGTYGEDVFQAKLKADRRKLVVTKKIFLEESSNDEEKFPITALREISVLQSLKHENIVNLIEVWQSKDSQQNSCKSMAYLVYDYCDHDLFGLLTNKKVFLNLGEIKNIMQQLLIGLGYVHNNKVLHMNVKTSNVLITRNGTLKLADFSLAQVLSINKNSKNNIFMNKKVCLWYRSPELLLGDENYGPPVDLWGVGCIMAEMWTRFPILKGNSEQEQLALISRLCGPIEKKVWPEVEKLDLYNELKLFLGSMKKVEDLLEPYVKDPNAIDLIHKLLNLNPSERYNADLSLKHDFFLRHPLPSDLKEILLNHALSTMDYITEYGKHKLNLH